MTYVLFLLFVPLDQTLLKGTARVIRLLRPVTNEKLLFNSVIQIAGLLEGTNVKLQERV
jgi:hypothetical protein